MVHLFGFIAYGHVDRENGGRFKFDVRSLFLSAFVKFNVVSGFSGRGDVVFSSNFGEFVADVIASLFHRV